MWKSGLEDQEVHYSTRVFPDFWCTCCFSGSHSVHISIQGAMRIDIEYRFFTLSDATIAMVQLDRGTEKSRDNLSPMLVPEEKEKALWVAVKEQFDSQSPVWLFNAVPYLIDCMNIEVEPRRSRGTLFGSSVSGFLVDELLLGVP